MTSHAASYHGYRFPPEIISHAAWLYHRFCLSFRDTEDLLAQRGITVSYEAIRQWCRRFGPAYARILRRRQGRLGDTWHLDELFVNIHGRQQYLWRAVDQDGDVIDNPPPAQARSAGGRTLLPEAIERAGPCATASDHGQASQLFGGPRPHDALRCAHHDAVREQSSRSLSSTNPPARAPDAEVQIYRSRATILVGTRPRAESLSRGPSPATGCSPPCIENPLLPCVERRDVRVLKVIGARHRRDRHARSSST